MRIIFIYNYYMELTNDNIITAINMYLNNKKKATIIYGNIEEWNTENITDMQKLFMNKRKFNNDISKWNVSNVTNMNYMFYNATELQKKFKTLNTLSFFSDKFITMDCNKRKKIFNKLFNWERRKNFVIFLHNYNYSILRNFIT